MNAAVPNIVDRILHDKYKDQKAVELETTELIAGRTIKWAKAFGFFLSIPVLFVGALLSFIGIKSYSDPEKIAAAQKQTAAATKVASIFARRSFASER